MKNEEDEKALSFLESFPFQSGIAAASIAQPAIAPLTGLAIGLTKMIANRSKNLPIPPAYLGLDFSNIANRARLAEGSYIAVQIPESMQLA